nr:hypothetical protein [Snodgrassella alvi]
MIIVPQSNQLVNWFFANMQLAVPSASINKQTAFGKEQAESKSS